MEREKEYAMGGEHCENAAGQDRSGRKNSKNSMIAFLYSRFAARNAALPVHLRKTRQIVEVQLGGGETREVTFNY